MTYDEYQQAAHSTAVYGNNNSYPFMAVVEETAEVMGVWVNHTMEVCKSDVLTADVRVKFCDEIGDVCWNVAELMTILNMKMSESSDTIVVAKHDPTWLDRLYQIVWRVGMIEGVYAKWTRKHDGVQPTNADLINQTDIVALVEALWTEVRLFITAVGLTVDEVLKHNIDKLAARKASNTLGGAGSVARKE